jgi:hypothetical protein
MFPRIALLFATTLVACGSETKPVLESVEITRSVTKEGVIVTNAAFKGPIPDMKARDALFREIQWLDQLHRFSLPAIQPSDAEPLSGCGRLLMAPPLTIEPGQVEKTAWPTASARSPGSR